MLEVVRIVALFRFFEAIFQPGPIKRQERDCFSADLFNLGESLCFIRVGQLLSLPFLALGLYLLFRKYSA